MFEKSKLLFSKTKYIRLKHANLYHPYNHDKKWKLLIGRKLKVYQKSIAK